MSEFRYDNDVQAPVELPPKDELSLTADHEDILRDYFTNDSEGWERGYYAWRKRAMKSLGIWKGK